MKIGILTYHRAHNFGAILQAMATRYVIQKLGHEAYFVDYWPEYHAKRYELKGPSVLSIIRHPIRYIQFLRSKDNKLARINCFDEFIKTNIDPFCKPISEEYDVVLYGSDQIWRKQRELNDFNEIYFASSQIKTKKRISFAASTDKLPQIEDYDKYKKLLNNFDAISVREDELFNICEKLGYTVSKLIDPTFLLDKDEWIKLLDIKKTNEDPYVLYYIMKQGVFDLNNIKDFCNKKNLKLKVLHGYMIDKDDEENISIADPREMVSLIYNADYVITTSFHGLAFAINMEKQFFVSTDFGVDRITSVLKEFDLEDRFVDGKCKLTEMSNIDFNERDSYRKRLRDESFGFLENNI